MQNRLEKTFVILRIFIASLILSPLLIIVVYSKIDFAIDLDETLWAIKNSFFQSSLSAIFSCFAGFILFRGLIYITNIMAWPHFFLKKIEAFFKSILLLPSFVPPLILILTILKLIEPFPFGIVGIVLAHIFTYAGFFAVQLKEFADKKIGKQLFVAESLGANGTQLSLLLFRILKKEILSLALIIFVFCFTSFSIPLVLGGGKATTLEVLIYEKILISGNIPVAVTLSLLQLAIVFALQWMAFKVPFEREQEKPFYSRKICSSVDLIILILMNFAFWVPIFLGTIEGTPQLLELPGILPELEIAFVNSIVFSLLTGLITLGIFSVLAYPRFLQKNYFRFLQSQIPASTVLGGLAILILATKIDLEPRFLYSFALAILIVPYLFRQHIYHNIVQLDRLIFTAQSLGATNINCFFTITIPILWPFLCRLAGISAVWAFGEFALGKMILGKPITLPLIAEVLVENYRINAGVALGGFILFLSAFLYLLFWRLGEIFSKKSI